MLEERIGKPVIAAGEMGGGGVGRDIAYFTPEIQDTCK